MDNAHLITKDALKNHSVGVDKYEQVFKIRALLLHSFVIKGFFELLSHRVRLEC